MKSFMAKKELVEHKWLLVDAENAILGRMAAKIAPILMGKTKPTYTPHVDTGDYVVVVNAEKIRVTGSKLQQKKYYRHSGYPGGLSEITLADQLDRHPTRVIKAAVRGMLPRNRLGRKMFKKLKVYSGPEHPHQAQHPKQLEL